MWWLGVFGIFFVGFWVGYLACALGVVSRQAEENTEEIWKKNITRWGPPTGSDDGTAPGPSEKKSD